MHVQTVTQYNRASRHLLYYCFILNTKHNYIHFQIGCFRSQLQPLKLVSTSTRNDYTNRQNSRFGLTPSIHIYSQQRPKAIVHQGQILHSVQKTSACSERLQTISMSDHFLQQTSLVENMQADQIDVWWRDLCTSKCTGACLLQVDCSTLCNHAAIFSQGTNEAIISSRIDHRVSRSWNLHVQSCLISEQFSWCFHAVSQSIFRNAVKNHGAVKPEVTLRNWSHLSRRKFEMAMDPRWRKAEWLPPWAGNDGSCSFCIPEFTQCVSATRPICKLSMNRYSMVQYIVGSYDE